MFPETGGLDHLPRDKDVDEHSQSYRRGQEGQCKYVARPASSPVIIADGAV
jgi:hypothetical protein